MGMDVVQMNDRHPEFICSTRRCAGDLIDSASTGEDQKHRQGQDQKYVLMQFHNYSLRCGFQGEAKKEEHMLLYTSSQVHAQ